MTEIVNEQRKISVDTRELALFADRAVRELPETQNRQPEILLVDNERIRGLNREFRGKDAATDVLSFRYLDEEFEAGDSLGDIVISVERAKLQANENEIGLELELKQLVLHGIIHLCGYDHEHDDGEMDALELKLRARLKVD